MKRFLLFLLIMILTIPVHALADKPILTIDTGGHKAKINDIMFTKDGRYLVSASNDKTIRVWDTSNGEVVRVLRGNIGKGFEGMIYAAAISPDDRLLAVGGYVGSFTGKKAREEEGASKIRLIDFKTGEVKKLLKGHTGVIDDLKFSPDGTLLISGSSDKTARIWNVRTQKTIYVLRGHTDRVNAVAFSHDGIRAVTGSYDDTLKLWNVKSGSLIRTLYGHTDAVRSASFTPDGRYLLSGSDDKTIRLWDGNTGKFIKILANFDKRVTGLTITPDSSKVLIGNLAKYGPFKCNVISIPYGKKVTSFTKNTNIVRATNISPNGRIAATGGGNDYEIFLWDLTTGKVKHKMVGKGKSIWSVGFAKDGQFIGWGKKYENRNLFMIGSLKQSFQIKSDSRTYELSMGPELSSGYDFIRGIKSVGPLSIRTKNDNFYKTLEILKNGRLVHEITWRSNYHRGLTLTPDGRTIICGDSWGNIASYNPQTGKKINKFIGHTSDVWGVAASPDSRLLVSGSADQTVKLWAIDSGKLLLTIFQGTDNEWVAWTPEGYYTASLNGDRYVGWHINRGENKSALYYTASRFSKQFYSPKIVAKYIETGGNIKETVRLANLDRPRQKKIDETAVSDIGNILPPAVFFQIPANRDVTVKQNSIRIRAGAKAITNEPITDIWLLVNGRRISESRGIGVKAKVSKKIERLRAELDIVVPLTQTDNRISVIASNRHTQSEPEIINVKWKTKAVGTVTKTSNIYKPDLYLLSIGVSKYQRSEYSLDYAHKDAEGIASVLNRQSGKLYGKIHKKIITNQHAIRNNILDGLDWILKESTQKDLSVIFVAGHGLKDDRGNYYFLPHDGDPDKLRRTGVRWVEFQDVLLSLPSKVVFLVDTCHSGSATGKRRGVDDVTDALRELVNAESGVVVMTASTGKESSQERSEWGHGAFTKALIEGLEGKADYDMDNKVDVKEIDLFITKRVKALTNGSQHPTTEIPKTMPNFPLVYK
jgi:WD40 repeat protein